MNEAAAIVEWLRAEECRQVAQLCLRHGFYADAISRAYYATLHGAKSALALYGVSPNTHRGVSGMFALHLIKPGLVEREWRSVIGRLARLRQAADYDSETAFSETDAARAYAQAAAFINRIHTLLTVAIAPERLQQRPN